MAEHENCVGESDEWYTPMEIFAALGLLFDLDPCSPGKDLSHVPARNVFTKDEDGLSKPWRGLVFMNPPFGGRHGHIPWLEKFLDHGNGVAIVRSYTSAGWWHDHMHRAHALLWPRGKTKFVKPDGSIGKAPGHGIVLIGMGQRAVAGLHMAQVRLPGMLWDRTTKPRLDT